MSVTLQTPFKSFTAAPAATLFSTDFRVILATDLVVRKDGVVQTTGFTVSGLGNPSGVDVTFGVPMVGGEIIELQRSVPLVRATDYQQTGDFLSPVVNIDFDRLWMALQDSQFLSNLAILLPLGDPLAPMSIPNIATRASKFLAFDALGQAIAAAGSSGVPVSPFMATLLDDLNAAAARTTLGALGAGPITSSGLTMATARFLARLTAGTGAIEELTAIQMAAALGPRSTILPIEASVAANALTVTVNPCATDFRSVTAGNGAVTTLSNAAAISCVVPSGATLGASNGALTRLAVLEINNAGTKEVAVVNLLGGVNLNERGVISTTALSTGADSANVIYSTTARSNVPYRIAGFIEYTQATAGTYATAPSLVNGSSAPLAMWLAGYGQTRQALAKVANTDYLNDTGRTIEAYVSVSAAALINVNGQIGGVNRWVINADTSLPGQVYLRILDGETYRVNTVGTVSLWSEVR